jgi:hypothetical protein
LSVAHWLVAAIRLLAGVKGCPLISVRRGG